MARQDVDGRISLYVALGPLRGKVSISSAPGGGRTSERGALRAGFWHIRPCESGWEIRKQLGQPMFLPLTQGPANGEAPLQPVRQFQSNGPLHQQLSPLRRPLPKGTISKHRHFIHSSCRIRSLLANSVSGIQMQRCLVHTQHISLCHQTRR